MLLLLVIAIVGQVLDASARGKQVSGKLMNSRVLPRSPHRSGPTAITTDSIVKRYEKLMLGFERNEGQAPSNVVFLARGRGYSLFLTAREAVLAVRKGSRRTSSDLGVPNTRTIARAATIRMMYVGASPNVEITGSDQQDGRVNYFVGNNPEKWRRDIVTYGHVRYHDLYPGIDAIYYGNQGMLENDFVVAPAASVSSIRLRFEGTKSTELDPRGRLFLHVSGGMVELQPPNAYQDIEGFHHQIRVSYRRIRDNEFGFAVGRYDRSHPLTIDPTLSYSTYVGGSDDDDAFGIASTRTVRPISPEPRHLQITPRRARYTHH